jgi:dolichol-phosphate mannosyltransferase
MELVKLGKDAINQVTREELTVVIPTLNEAEAIGMVIDELRKYGYERILVVDGYSTDGTISVALERDVHVIRQTGKGKSGALRTAIDHVKTPYMLVMDGDFTYDPSDIEKLTAHGRAYDEVIGARTGGRKNIPRLNRIGNGVLSWFFKVMFAVSLRDVCSGMYLLRTESVRDIEFTTAGFDVEVEIAAQMADNRRIADVPINYRPRVGRQKLSSLRHGFPIAFSILRLANVHNPVLLYSGLVAFSAIPALSILGWVLWERIYRNIFHSGYALFGAMLLIIAFQSIAVATISLLIKRSEHRILRASRHQTR